MIEIPDAVAHFVTTVRIRDDISDTDFSRYEGSILHICRKNKKNILLAEMIKETASQYALNAKQLTEESELLAERVRESALMKSEDSGMRYCRICKKWLPVDRFRRRKSGSIETACWPCEREEKRLYQQGRARKRTRPERETVVE